MLCLQKQEMAFSEAGAWFLAGGCWKSDDMHCGIHLGHHPSVSFIGSLCTKLGETKKSKHRTQRWPNSHDSHASKFWSDKVFVHMMCCQSFFVGILVIPCKPTFPRVVAHFTVVQHTPGGGQQTHWIATVLVSGFRFQSNLKTNMQPQIMGKKIIFPQLFWGCFEKKSLKRKKKNRAKTVPQMTPCRSSSWLPCTRPRGSGGYRSIGHHGKKACNGVGVKGRGYP